MAALSDWLPPAFVGSLFLAMGLATLAWLAWVLCVETQDVLAAPQLTTAPDGTETVWGFSHEPPVEKQIEELLK